MSTSHAVLLVNLGTPDAPTESAVRAFLAEFLSDPQVVDWPRAIWLPILRGIVLRRRPAKALAMYRSIWGESGSPLAVGTKRLAAALDQRFGDDVQVSAAFRYGRNGLARALPESARKVGGKIVVLPLFPQRTASSSGTIRKLAYELAHREGLTQRLIVLELPPDDPDYLAALADRCRDAIAHGFADTQAKRRETGSIRPPKNEADRRSDIANHSKRTKQTQKGEHRNEAERLVVSFHGIPLSHDRREKGSYRSDCRRTFRGLLDRLAWNEDRADLCYQSRFGPGRWLEPATESHLISLGRSGVRDVLLIAPGFLTEGLETLEELDQRADASFREAGGRRLVRARAPVDHPLLLASLETRIRQALDA